MVQQEQPGTEIIVQKGGDLYLPPGKLPKITPDSVAETKQAISLLQGMVKDILTQGIDYGKVPGIAGEFLWDPGASMIISSFNCYVGPRRILSLVDNEEKVSACVEVSLMSHTTQRVVATGIGAASSLETKHKYRWVKDPHEWGYNDEAMKSLKTKEDNGVKTYRILNPEHSEMVNTIIKMASKRGEADAAQSLPGVASVLRKVFSGYKTKGEKGTGDDKWNWFWGEARRIGFTQEQVHSSLGVTSMKEWTASGRTLEQGVETLIEQTKGRERGNR